MLIWDVSLYFKISFSKKKIQKLLKSLISLESKVSRIFKHEIKIRFSNSLLMNNYYVLITLKSYLVCGVQVFLRRQFWQFWNFSVENALMTLLVEKDEIFVRPFDYPSLFQWRNLNAKSLVQSRVIFVVTNQGLHFVLVA